MLSSKLFADRAAAGVELASALQPYAHSPETIVLALPRGGLPVAAQLARLLHLPLDILLVRKLGVPWSPEVAFGAVVLGELPVLDERVMRAAGVTEDQLKIVLQQELTVLQQRERLYRSWRPPIQGLDRTVIVVDDGVATGSTMRAALQCLRQQGARKLVVAVPVGPAETLQQLRQLADEVICLHTPARFEAVGKWYVDFSQVDDEEVRQALGYHQPGLLQLSSSLAIRSGVLHYDLTIPPAARGLVLFAHGGGSGRRSPRNTQLAAHLQKCGLATCLLDLLTEEEAEIDQREHTYRFAVGTLAERLNGIAEYLAGHQPTSALSRGYCGASTGAAAALLAAAARPELVSAIVTRGGRTDLAGTALASVHAPTLLIVGELDRSVLRLNQQSLSQMNCDHQLITIPEAGHLFEEPGALPAVAQEAARWFLRWLQATKPGGTCCDKGATLGPPAPDDREPPEPL